MKGQVPCEHDVDLIKVVFTITKSDGKFKSAEPQAKCRGCQSWLPHHEKNVQTAIDLVFIRLERKLKEK